MSQQGPSRCQRHWSAAAGAKDSAQIAALLAAGDKVIDEALSQQKYDLALELAEEAYKACAQSAGREHRKRAFDRRKQVQALAASFQDLRSVLDKLKADPDDPEANLAAGRHYCFDRQYGSSQSRLLREHLY